MECHDRLYCVIIYNFKSVSYDTPFIIIHNINYIVWYIIWYIGYIIIKKNHMMQNQIAYDTFINYIILYHMIKYCIIAYDTILCHTISYNTISYQKLLCYKIIWCNGILYLCNKIQYNEIKYKTNDSML